VTVVRTRALPSFAAGLRAAASRPWLVLGLWACQLVLAAAAALPLYRALSAATANSPATDRLLDRYSVSLFVELMHYTQLPVGQMVQMSAVGAFLVGLLLAPALLAAIVSALESPGRPARGEMAAAAGRWYWPFLRVFVLGRFAGLLVAGLVGGGLAVALRPVRQSLWEIGRLASWPAILAAALVPAALFFAATDYAMVHAVRTGSRRMFAAWRMGLRASFTRPLTTLALWFFFVLLIAGMAALLFSVLGTLSGSSRLGIALAFVVQQLFVLFRVGLRVGLVGAEAATWRVVPEPAPPSVEDAPLAPVESPFTEPAPGTA
jgi:hypothetical protein